MTESISRTLERVRMVLRCEGEPTEFFTIETFAAALGRSPATVRRWEREGRLPRARYRKPSRDHRGERRLYTAHQLTLARLAAEREGLHRRPNGSGGLSGTFQRQVATALRAPVDATAPAEDAGSQ